MSRPDMSLEQMHHLLWSLTDGELEPHEAQHRAKLVLADVESYVRRRDAFLADVERQRRHLRHLHQQVALLQGQVMAAEPAPPRVPHHPIVEGVRRILARALSRLV